MKNTCVYDEFGNLNQGASSDVGPSSGSLQNHDSSIPELFGDSHNFLYAHNKFLEFPVKVSKPNPRLANVVITQYGGPNGEIGASLRYLSQRYTMPDEVSKGLLTDIGTEELAH